MTRAARDAAETKMEKAEKAALREKGRREKANKGKKDADAKIAELHAEIAVLSSGDPKDPRGCSKAGRDRSAEDGSGGEEA